MHGPTFHNAAVENSLWCHFLIHCFIHIFLGYATVANILTSKVPRGVMRGHVTRATIPSQGMFVFC